MVLRDLHIWFNYQKATNDYHESNPRLLGDIGKRLTYIDQLQEFFCRLYGATYPLRGVDQARYDMFERKHQALERLTLEGAVELQVGLSNSQVKVPP
jgi:hypothetical protein